MKYILLILLLLNSQFCSASENPAGEFIRKEKINFSTKGHPKAKDINLSMAYPKSWLAEEGNRPNVVQKFTSENGRGLEMAIIVIGRIPLPQGVKFTSVDIDDLLSDESLRDMCPEGAKVLITKRTKIDNQPAGYSECTFTQERANTEIVMHMQTYLIYYNERIISVQYQVGAKKSADSTEYLNERMKLFSSLFGLMANSLIIHNQYNQNP